MTETERITHRIMDEWEDSTRSVNQYPHDNIVMESDWQRKVRNCGRVMLGALGFWALVGIALYMLIRW